MSEETSVLVTFLFTDIEGSTQLWERYPDGMKSALTRHDALLQQSVAAWQGMIVKSTGDGCYAVFASPADALAAALAIQQAMQGEAWQGVQPQSLRVRIGIHSGQAERRAGDYFGPALNRTARLMSAGHGGQVLVSHAAAELARDLLPEGARLADLGECRLKDLSRPERIFQLLHASLQSDFPPLRTLDSFPNNLPVQLTSFIGREKEIVEIRRLLGAARLVTLTGPGGTGKTRLSLEVGAQVLADFSHGVWLIELAPLSDPGQIYPALAQVFNLQELPFTPLANLVQDYLRDKKVLLVLDNCEHLIETCARLADDLLRQCAGLKILASSREALGIGGEVAYRIPSLEESESRRLFVERAQAVTPKFCLTAANTPAVTQICHRLDGIPLAIELAAARLRLLSAEQIAARLDDLFRLLVGGSRTALPRQQTLRALIDWSYDLLSESERRLLQFASVFVGGWTLEALEAVSEEPDTPELLEQLVNKSLVVTEEREGEMRYFMLETIRQYAREKLFEAKLAATARDRHFVYFDEYSEKFWNIFMLKNTLYWRAQADDEVENFRSALEWGLDHDGERAIHLAANFCLVCGWMGNRQTVGLELCNTAIERFRALPPATGSANPQRQMLLAKALFALGMIGMGSGNMPDVIRHLQEAIAIARESGDRLILGYCLEMYSIAGRFIDAPGVDEAAEEGYRIFHDEIKDNWGLSMAYQNMSRLASKKGNQVEKEKYLMKFKAMIEETPISFQAGIFFLFAGWSETSLGNYIAAKTYYEDGLAVFKQIRNKHFELAMASELGHTARHTGELAEAKGIYKETLRGWQNLGNRAAIANQLECFAFIAIQEEEPGRATKLLGAAEAMRETVQSTMTDDERLEYKRYGADLRAMLPEAELKAGWEDGRSLKPEGSIQLALREVTA